MYSESIGLQLQFEGEVFLPSPATSLVGWALRHLLDTLTVGDMMTRCVMTITPDRRMTEAVGRMRRQRVGALPAVADRRGGDLLTCTDVLRAFRRWSSTRSAAA